MGAWVELMGGWGPTLAAFGVGVLATVLGSLVGSGLFTRRRPPHE